MMMETSSTRLTHSPLARTDKITLLPRSFIGLYEKMEILAALPVTVIARRDLFGLIWRGDSVITSAVKAVFSITPNHVEQKPVDNIPSTIGLQ
ncbi:hypothetical protein [Rhizobium sp.]|uniref:hypothetical protein n=1 Tax=Rhizobium sp. TaxID=391 RepID=UPI002896434F